MKTKQNLCMLVFMAMLMGCGHEHKMIVEKVYDNKITVKDIKSDTEKVLVVNARRYDHLAYIHPGDILEYFDDGHSDFNYKDTVEIPLCGHLDFNKDSLYARLERELYAHTKYDKFGRVR